MATTKSNKVASHVGGDGSEYNGRKLTAPLPQRLRKKYSKPTNKKSAAKKK